MSTLVIKEFRHIGMKIANMICPIGPNGEVPVRDLWNNVLVLFLYGNVTIDCLNLIMGPAQDGPAVPLATDS